MSASSASEAMIRPDKGSSLVRNLDHWRSGLLGHCEDACGDFRPREDSGRLHPGPVARDD